jgi:DGC domain
MPSLPKKKVGLIACGGEELAEGTLSRVAIRLVLEKCRPDDTVTLCLPLFLAGEKEERAFARFYPTISIDGCGKNCARRATEAFSAPVAGAVRIDTLLAEMGITVRPGWRRILDDEGWAVAERLADAIAAQVDGILGGRRAAEPGAMTIEPDLLVVADAPCACATQIPVSRIEIAGQELELMALMAIFDDFYRSEKRPGDGSGRQLLEAVRVYNLIPEELLPAAGSALEREYAAFCAGRKPA